MYYGSSKPVQLSIAGEARGIQLKVGRLVVAGYTGRDRAAVQAHIDELSAIGVPPPPQIPMLFDLDPSLLTTDEFIEVDRPGTSGEVEPVIVRNAGSWYLTVGSDHTDRELETVDIARSKAACAKPMGRSALPLPDGLLDGDWDRDWDAMAVTCTVDGQLHQRGVLADMLAPSDLLPPILDWADGSWEDDLIIYCGTVPTIGGELRAGTRWALELTLASGASIHHTYQVRGEH